MGRMKDNLTPGPSPFTERGEDGRPLWVAPTVWRHPGLLRGRGVAELLRGILARRRLSELPEATPEEIEKAKPTSQEIETIRDRLPGPDGWMPGSQRARHSNVTRETLARAEREVAGEPDEDNT